MIFFLVLMVLVFIAQIAEFFIPPLDWMSNAHIYITPVLVFYGAISLPLPLLLVLVFWAGFLLDAVTAQVIGSHVEISFGSSILLYAVLAGIMHGLRPLFARGRWEVHCIMSGVCTSALLLGQYLMLSFRRGSIFFSREVWWQIGGPGLLAMIMAPLVFWALHWLARATAYPYLPDPAGYESVRVDLPNRYYDPEKGAALFDRFIEEWQVAEQEGFEIMITPLSPASRSTVCSVQREQDCRRRASSHPLTGGIIVIEPIYIEGGRFAQIPMRCLVQDSAALAGGQLDLRRARHSFRLVGPQGRIDVAR